MSYLVDTNVLLRSAQPSHPMYNDAVNSTTTLKLQGETLYVLSQNLVEFWVVATRPLDVNGLGMSVDEAEQELQKLKSFFSLLTDSPLTFAEWEKMVVQHKVAGKPAREARLVAAMNVHGISHILTFNADDFKRYANVTAVKPCSI
jgi:predicted nucleic acid-binding protein